MKCIGAIVNVCAICDVVYYVDAFLTLLCAKLIGKRKEICQEIFPEDIYNKNMLYNTNKLIINCICEGFWYH